MFSHPVPATGSGSTCFSATASGSSSVASVGWDDEAAFAPSGETFTCAARVVGAGVFLSVALARSWRNFKLLALNIRRSSSCASAISPSLIPCTRCAFKRLTLSGMAVWLLRSSYRLVRLSTCLSTGVPARSFAIAADCVCLAVESVGSLAPLPAAFCCASSNLCANRLFFRVCCPRFALPRRFPDTDPVRALLSMDTFSAIAKAEALGTGGAQVLRTLGAPVYFSATEGNKTVLTSSCCTGLAALDGLDAFPATFVFSCWDLSFALSASPLRVLTPPCPLLAPIEYKNLCCCAMRSSSVSSAEGRSGILNRSMLNGSMIYLIEQVFPK
eukprot:m.1348956 g.1348956  ORF g.1348956 m.1348956 type:complete len:329 (+) comp24916_c0_seq4:3075-4061(+)